MVDKSRNKLAGIDFSAGHGVEMPALGEVLIQNLVGIIDDSYYANGIGAQSGADKKRRGVGIVYAADCRKALHLLEDMLKLCTERRIFYIVDVALKTHFGVVGGDSSALCS